MPVARIPKTTSGKVQRFRLVEEFEAGSYDDALAALPNEPDLDSVAASASESELALEAASDQLGELHARLLSMCNARITDRRVSAHDNLFELGISSLTLAEIHTDIEDVWPDVLDITDLFDYPTVAEIAKVLQQRLG